MLRRLALLLLLGALLAPSAALAQFEPLPAPQQEPPPPPAPTTSDPDEGGLERWQQLAIFGGGVVLILGIGYGILHDARRRAPIEDENEYYGHGGAAHDTPMAKRKAEHRKKTKAQKAARKRQRARR